MLPEYHGTTVALETTFVLGLPSTSMVTPAASATTEAGSGSGPDPRSGPDSEWNARYFESDFFCSTLLSALPLNLYSIT